MWLISTSARVSTWKPSVADTGTISFQPSSPRTSRPRAATASNCSVRACRSTVSALVTIAMMGFFPTAASWAAMKRSPGPIFSLAGRQKPMASTSARVSATRSLRRLPRRVRGRCSPGVSTRISCASSRCTMPRMVCRVVCGLAEVMATFFPTNALVRVDLPALGLPTRTENPARKPPKSSCSAALFFLLTWNSLLGCFGLFQEAFKVSLYSWYGRRNDMADPVPPALQPVRPQRDALHVNAAAHDGDPAERLREEAAHRVHLVVVNLEVEKLAEVVD